MATSFGTGTAITARALNTAFAELEAMIVSGAAAAGSLTGNTLASNVIYSSLTSVGTLTSLTLSGNITLPNSANNVIFTTTTADTALPWSSGPAFQGVTGWAFYSTVAGSYRMGFRGNTGNTSRYLWSADSALIGSQPSDAAVTNTLNVIGTGRFTGKLTVDDASSPSITIGDWSASGLGAYTAIEGYNGYIITGHTSDRSVYLRTNSNVPVYIGGNQQNTLEVGSTSAKVYGFLDVDGASSQNIRIGDWTGGASYSVIENAYGYLLMGAAGDQRMYLRTYANDVRIGTPASDTLIVSGTNVSINKPINAQLEVSNTNVYISGTSGSYVQHSTNTGSGQAAQWTAFLGLQVLVRNTSTRDDKENIQSIAGVLTPSMIDDVYVLLWNRKTAPGIPEVGPMAEDMNDISPFLATHGMDVDGDGNIVRTPPNGISPNGWMSLLTIALQESRQRISILENKVAELEKQ